MPLKLDRLPDRETARITFTASAELKAALNDYAEIYRQTYGAEEKPEALIPAMIESFLASDAGFKRARRALHANASNER